MAEQSRAEVTLTPAGQRVMDILSRQRSGYGREQLLLVALRIACRTIAANGPYPVVEPTEGNLFLTYLEMAEASLKDDPDA